MKRKYYYIKGEELTIEQLSQRYGISIPTLYRRINSGMSIEECVEYKRKPRKCDIVYIKDNQIEYPENLILDLIGDKKDFKFDLAKIKENFEENYNAMLYENQNFFEIRDVNLIEDIYQNHMPLAQVAKKYNISIQWVFRIKKSFILTLQKQYFSDYYLMGKKFVDMKEDYYKFRENQLVEELGLIPDENNDETLLPDRQLMVNISIKRLELPETLEAKFKDKKITTVNQILDIEKKDLKSYIKLSAKELVELKEAIKVFVNRGYYYV